MIVNDDEYEWIFEIPLFVFINWYKLTDSMIFLLQLKVSLHYVQYSVDEGKIL